MSPAQQYAPVPRPASLDGCCKQDKPEAAAQEAAPSGEQPRASEAGSAGAQPPAEVTMTDAGASPAGDEEPKQAAPATEPAAPSPEEVLKNLPRYPLDMASADQGWPCMYPTLLERCCTSAPYAQKWWVLSPKVQVLRCWSLQWHAHREADTETLAYQNQERIFVHVVV